MEGALCGFIEDDILLKASEPGYAVALFVIGVARLDDVGEADSAHDFADAHCREVSVGDHPDAHGGIDGEIFHAREGLAVFYFWHRRFG